MKSSERGSIVTIFTILLLLAGLAVGVYMIGQQTFLKSRASSDAVKVKSAQGEELPQENGIPVTTDLNVQLELNPPPAPE
jgi:hypothetical protein